MAALVPWLYEPIDDGSGEATLPPPDASRAPKQKKLPKGKRVA